MCRWFRALPLLTVLLVVGVGAGCPNEAIGPVARTGADKRQPPNSRAARANAAAAKRAMETICDRQEDCAIERNVALARAYGGTKADLESARLQARIALHSGYVRRWCLMRMSSLRRPQLMQIHKCLSRTACEPFYQCAARVRNTPPPASSSARLPK